MSEASELDQLIQRQIEREELQKQLGLEQFEHQLKKQKLGRDYSRSAGGRLIEKTMMQQLTEEVEAVVERAITGAGGTGVGIGDFAEAYERTADLPVFDLDTGEPSGELFTAWDSNQASLITLRTLIDCCHMPIAGMGKSGKRFGHRPNYYELTTLVGRRIETQAILNYSRKHFPDSEWHQGLISRKLRYWYGNKASADQFALICSRLLWLNRQGRRSPFAPRCSL